jgi:CheY-like chemotaxis protein
MTFEPLLRQRSAVRSATGFAFRFARHGEEALAALADDPAIDLLLLDVNMPVMDGLTLLSVLRDRRCWRRAKPFVHSDRRHRGPLRLREGGEERMSYK